MLEFRHDKQSALIALCEAYSDRIALSPCEIESLLHGWEFVEITANGQSIGAVAVHDGEGHIGIRKEFRGKWGGADALNAMCDKFLVNKTSVGHDNERSMRWLERCGWHRVGQDQFGVKYER